MVNTWNDEILKFGSVRYKVLQQDDAYIIYDYMEKKNVFETVEVAFMNCFIMGLKVGYQSK